MKAAAMNGPTHVQQPVFSWTETKHRRGKPAVHLGQPTAFDFAWVDMVPHGTVGDVCSKKKEA